MRCCDGMGGGRRHRLLLDPDAKPPVPCRHERRLPPCRRAVLLHGIGVGRAACGVVAAGWAALPRKAWLRHRRAGPAAACCGSPLVLSSSTMRTRSPPAGSGRMARQSVMLRIMASSSARNARPSQRARAAAAWGRKGSRSIVASSSGAPPRCCSRARSSARKRGGTGGGGAPPAGGAARGRGARPSITACVEEAPPEALRCSGGRSPLVKASASPCAAACGARRHGTPLAAAVGRAAAGRGHGERALLARAAAARARGELLLLLDRVLRRERPAAGRAAPAAARGIAALDGS